MFQEFRPLWHVLCAFRGNSNNAEFSLQSLHVFDQMEVFFDGNNRNINIEIETAGHGRQPRGAIADVTKVSLTGSRNEAANLIDWRAVFYVGNRKLTNTWMPIAGGGDFDFSAAERNYFNIDLIVELFDKLNKSLYIGPFRNAITVGTGSHFDLAVGENFINLWHEWQNGGTKKHNNAIVKVEENICRVAGFDKLSITASTQIRTMQLNINGRPFKLNEVGAGLAQLIVVFGNALIRGPSIIFIDEPELNLHPRLQLEFLTSLASYAEHGIVFATHSIGLARSAAERIYAVYNDEKGSSVVLYEKNVNLVEMLGELSFSAVRELGAEKILLVEGTTDVKVFQQLLRKAGKEHKIVVLPLGGHSLARGDVAHELRELLRVAEHVAAIVDSERDAQDAEPIAERREFAKICQDLQFEVLVTERRATENYFDEDSIQKALGASYKALGAYDKLGDSVNGWSKADNWRIAAELDWDNFKKTDLGRFVDGL
ncbi:AAA family ATPase [Burkholderia plantarii]|uniref:AAA family ATPase n=1 Tax=Burkholderia plantarii TaxID=41899 RepID=UPI002729E98E|nr:AAA family ATPase [Burkholderia plantarii]